MINITSLLAVQISNRTLTEKENNEVLNECINSYTGRDCFVLHVDAI